MPLTCPVCRAVNDGGPGCRRCKADLSLCFAVDAQRAGHLAAAADDLLAGHPAEALAHAGHAASLRRGPDAFRLQAVAHLLGRDFARAWRAYVQSSGGSAG